MVIRGRVLRVKGEQHPAAATARLVSGKNQFGRLQGLARRQARLRTAFETVNQIEHRQHSVVARRHHIGDLFIRKVLPRRTRAQQPQRCPLRTADFDDTLAADEPVARALHVRGPRAEQTLDAILPADPRQAAGI